MIKESGFPCARGVARTFATLLAALLIATSAARSTPAQSLSYDRERGREMLDLIKSDIKKNYYDPTFHGIDLEARFRASSQDINDFERDEENAETERRAGSRQVEVGDDLLIWKLAEFDLTDSEVDDVLSKARKHKSLIIDLRGNGGGAETTLLRMLGSVFDHDVKLGDIKRRKETKPLVAKTRADNAFKGNLVVLVDSQSGSAAELFARVVQLEKRGAIVGDRSAGAVMRSKFYDHQSGTESVALYGASITDADITMTDGKSLEPAGVPPDRLLLPTGADLAAQRDPVLALAAALVGVKLEPEKAGTFFPYKWRK
jgi:C-terminal processing protease CtpA/Prc